MSSRRYQPGRSVTDMALSKEEFAKRVRSARVRSGQSQGDAADTAGISLRNWQRYESGEIMPRAHALPKVASAIGVPVGHLEEAATETVLERLERKMDNNALMARQILGVIDAVNDRLNNLAGATSGRYDQLVAGIEELGARVSATETTLSGVQQDFLRALGADVPQPASNAPGQAEEERSTTNPAPRNATGRS